MKRVSNGFTLVEMMVVVAIAGIIFAIAYPSYQDHVIATKRADGMAAMVSLQQAMERYRAANYDYNVTSVDDVFANQVPVDGGAAYYSLTAEPTDGGAGYLLTATPVGSLAGKDNPLTVTHTGARTWGVKTCWPERNTDC